MRYIELLESDDSFGNLASVAMDILTPLASNGIQSVEIDKVIEKLQKIPSGFKIDRPLILKLLDPNRFPLVKKIEGNTIYFDEPPKSGRAVSDEDKASEQAKIAKKATQQAVQNVKSGS